MCTWISYPINNYNLCATQAPSIGHFFHLLNVTDCIWPQQKSQWVPHSPRLPFLEGCFGLGGCSSQECPREFCWGLVQGNCYWIHKGKVAFLPTQINQDLSTDTTGQHFWQHFYPGLKERQGPEYHCGVHYQEPRCIFMCSNKNATLPQLVFVSISGHEGHLDIWFASLHSSLTGFC